MSEQSDSAAERSAHVTRGTKPTPADWPVVEVTPGVFKLRAVVDLEAQVASLRRAIAAMDKAMSELWHDGPLKNPHPLYLGAQDDAWQGMRDALASGPDA